MPASACRAQSNLFVATLYIRGYGVWDSCEVAGCRAPPQQNSAPPEGPPLWLQCVERTTRHKESRFASHHRTTKKFWRCVIQMSKQAFLQTSPLSRCHTVCMSANTADQAINFIFHTRDVGEFIHPKINDWVLKVANFPIPTGTICSTHIPQSGWSVATLWQCCQATASREASARCCAWQSIHWFISIIWIISLLKMMFWS